MVMHLLVVDDDETVRASIRDALTREGVRVSVAAGGREALDRIAADPVDLILTDMRMPGMDGLELLRRVRDRAPGPDVVLMTGFDDAGVAVVAAREGARAYLAKPLDLPDLRALVGGLLRERAERCRPADPSHWRPGSVP